MKLVSFQKNKQSEIRLGVVIGTQVADLELLGKELNQQWPHTMLDLIDKGKEFWNEVSSKITQANGKSSKASYALSDVILKAPIPKPRKNIFGIGLNYTEHVTESARSLDTSGKLPTKCIIFSKPPTTVIGTGDAIEHNAELTQQLDYEGELAVIIGKKGKNITKDKALEHVFGYTIINDVSARDCRREGQWIVSKGQDTFAPMGPVLVTADELSNPHNLQITTKVNGVEKQNGNTKYMLFNVNAIIEDISKVMTLEPGDIIASGTPAGVGAGRTPQEWMWPGDIVEISIEGIGTLKNPIVKV